MHMSMCTIYGNQCGMLMQCPHPSSQIIGLHMHLKSKPMNIFQEVNSSIFFPKFPHACSVEDVKGLGNQDNVNLEQIHYN